MESAACVPTPTDRAWDWAGLRRAAGREARRLLADPHEAEDAVQEAMIRAWRQRASCRSPHAPEAWLRQIARNEAARHYGRTSAHPAEQLSEESEECAVADAPQERVLDRLRFDETLRRLRSDDDRRLLLLRYELDLPDVAIARSLGIAESTVRVRLHRLKRQLRVLISEAQ